MNGRLAGLLLLSVIVASGCGSSNPVAPSAPPVAAPPAAVVPPAPSLPPRDPAQFNQTFWNEFVHNGFEAPPGTAPLRRLTSSPHLYIRTVDEAGIPIDALTLQTVEDAVRVIAPTWGGGVITVAGIERGTSTHEGQAGWITVKWPNPSAGVLCGRSPVGEDGGAIELNYLYGGTCACNGSKIRPRTVYHELGHAFGYWHTDSDADIMRNPGPGCDARPSSREVYHAQLAYLTPVGTTTALSSGHVVIID